MTRRIKSLCIFAVLLSLAGASSLTLAATKVYLHTSASKIRPPSGWSFYAAVQGTSVVGTTMNTVSGPITGQYFPSTTTGHIFNNGSVNILWLSYPLTAGVTISGVITPNLWGYESNVAANAACRYEVLRWSVAQGGIVSSLGISGDNGMAEWGTAAAAKILPTLTPTSTAFVTGDRIVILIYNDDGTSVTEASGRTWTLDTNGTTGSDGDTYLLFTETISLAGTDSNNGRNIPLISNGFIEGLFFNFWRFLNWTFGFGDLDRNG